MNITHKAELLFTGGEKEKAIEILENFVSSREGITKKKISALESLAIYKNMMKKDYSSEIEVLENVDDEEVFGFTFFLIGLHYEKSGNREKAVDYFNRYVNRVLDPLQYAESFGGADDWLRIEREFFSKISYTDNDIYKKCNYGENVEFLSDREKECLLCVSFVEEVNSGGLEGYFSTEYSKYCVEAAEYQKKNNSVIYPEVLRKAISLFPENFDFSYFSATEEYLEDHNDILDEFEKLESRIYESTEDIDSILEKLEEQV